jgi:hypothetical protein
MSIFVNYKDVGVNYKGSGIYCKDVSVSVNNSLDSARDRNTISNADVFGTQRPVTNISLSYLINNSGDIFYSNFKDVFNGQANLANFSGALSVGSLEFSNVYPQSLSLSATNNSLFEASVDLIYFGNVEAQLTGNGNEGVYNDYISLGHLANTPISGVDYAKSVSCDFNVDLNPIFFMGNNTNTPDFVDVVGRNKSCTVTSNNLKEVVSLSGDVLTVDFDVKDFYGTSLQNYAINGRVSSHAANLTAEDTLEGTISITDFV